MKYCVIPPRETPYVATFVKGQESLKFLKNTVGEDYQEISTVGQFPVVGSYLYVDLGSEEAPNYIASVLSGRPINGTAVVFGGKREGKDLAPRSELVSKILNDKAFCKTYSSIGKSIHENY